MASRVPLLRSGRGERAIADGLPTAEPPLGDGGSREARPSERRRTGEPSSARPGRRYPGPSLYFPRIVGLVMAIRVVTFDFWETLVKDSPD
ncbi:MAG TPA: hypothetical protein VFO18_15675, partial [Methylomirabilota bacterium]|nr:hypothetical protein [Methylomirabilota bacterium]